VTGTVDAVVLAGGINTVSVHEDYVPDYKALLRFSGRPSIACTLAALRGEPRVGRICVVGPRERIAAELGAEDAAAELEWEAGGDSLLESFVHGLRHFSDSPAVLFITADVPLVTAGSIAKFLDACGPQLPAADSYIMLLVVPEQCYSADWADCPKAVSRFRDVTVCHGNVMLASPRILGNHSAMRRINPLYNARKNPLAAALAVGLRVGVSYIVGVHITHRLSLARMAAIASWRFGMALVPVQADCPELTVDIDGPADYEYVSRRIAIGNDARA
jgi:CTP:molybdopterin cytidylyltransferase MocA